MDCEQSSTLSVMAGTSASGSSPAAGLHRYALIFLFCAAAVGGMIVLCMFTYPIPYSWGRHYLSAMGLTRLNDGTGNWPTAAVFNSALVLAGAMSAAYFILRGNMIAVKSRKYLLWCAAIAGGAALAGIGLIPYNWQPDWHNWCTYIASGGLGLAILLCAFAGETPAARSSDNVLWVIFAFFVLLIWIALERLRQEGLLPSTPTGQLQQKLMVAFFWLYMFCNSLFFYRRTRPLPADSEFPHGCNAPNSMQ